MLYMQKTTRRPIQQSRVVNVCNSLPESVVFTSLSTIKRSIRTVDFNQFLKCNSATVSVVISLVVLLMYVMFLLHFILMS